MHPHRAMENYQPQINLEVTSSLGKWEDEDIFTLVTVTVPKEIEKMTCNLQAPIIINMKNNRAVQVIVENDYPIKYSLAHLLQRNEEKAGE